MIGGGIGGPPLEAGGDGEMEVGTGVGIGARGEGRGGSEYVSTGILAAGPVVATVAADDGAVTRTVFFRCEENEVIRQRDKKTLSSVEFREFHDMSVRWSGFLGRVQSRHNGFRLGDDWFHGLENYWMRDFCTHNLHCDTVYFTIL